MDVEQTLQRIGLSPKEAQLYFALSKSGSATAIRLSRVTGINRRSVYDLLESLIARGLVHYYLVDQKKVFQPSSLDSLLALADEQKMLAEKLRSELSQIALPQKVEPLIEIHSGKKSLKGIFERVLAQKETFYIYGGSMPAREFLETYYPQWTKKRVQRGIKIKGIFVSHPAVKKYVSKLPLIEYRFIEEEYLNPAFWWLQGNTVYTVFFQANPTVIVIESKELAKTYHHSFELLWKKAAKS